MEKIDVAIEKSKIPVLCPFLALYFVYLFVYLFIYLCIYIFAALISGKFATTPKPVISLNPPWIPAIEGETVLLTCNGFDLHSPRKITWYHGNTNWTTTENTLKVHTAGEYRCQIQDSASSYPVHLQFSSAPLTLQAPVSVFQDDSVVLKCRAKENVVLNSLKIYKNTKILTVLNNSPEFHIHQASLKDNGEYFCKGVKESNKFVSSNSVKIEVEELFPLPVLTARPSQPTEGTLVTLTCEVQLPPQRLDIQLQFRFFRGRQALGSGWSHSPEFHIFNMRQTGSYSCNAKAVTLNRWKQSHEVQIRVQSPVSQPVLTFSPSGAQAFEGDNRTIYCEAYRGSPPILYQFYHQDVILGKSSKLYGGRASFSLSLTKEHSGKYYCTAENDFGVKRSEAVSLLVTVPVSQPVLTLRTPVAEAFVGHIIIFSCESQSGSPPILYQFYHNNVILKKIEVPLRIAVYFRFSLTTEHTGKYHCSADNGLGAQHSKEVDLAIKVPVSQPVLTLQSPGARVLEGEEITFYCKAQRGSPRIVYKLYHEGVFLRSRSNPYGGGAFFKHSLTAEHSGKYYCTAENGFGPQQSEAVSLFVTVPVSHPVLTIRAPRTQTAVGDMVELHCEAQRGSPPILYCFYHEDVTLGNISVLSKGGASFSLSLTEGHSGSYHCTADNGLGTQHSYSVSLSVRVPVSRPVLTLWTPRTQTVVGDLVKLHCEAQKGSPPILYRFYHEDVTLGSISVLSGRGAFFNLSLTTEHSGNYSCEANNSLGAQLSHVVTLNVKVPVSSPVLTVRAPGAQAVVGDVVELHCEAWRGSPPILYQFYHEDVILGNSSVCFRGGVSFNLSLTIEHSGNFSCEADNGLGAQRSEAVTLSIRVFTGSRSGSVATQVTRGLLSMMGLAAVALLFCYWLLRKAGRKSTSDPTRSPSNSDPQEPTYHNVPAWIELQPMYSNVNLKGGEVIYSEVRSSRKEKTCAVTSAPRLLKDQVSLMTRRPSPRAHHSLALTYVLSPPRNPLSSTPR
ncbi:Fc receptor-like protein 5 [Trichechus inunguis]